MNKPVKYQQLSRTDALENNNLKEAAYPGSSNDIKDVVRALTVYLNEADGFGSTTYDIGRELNKAFHTAGSNIKTSRSRGEVFSWISEVIRSIA